MQQFFSLKIFCIDSAFFRMHSDKIKMIEVILLSVDFSLFIPSHTASEIPDLFLFVNCKFVFTFCWNLSCFIQLFKL